MRGRNRNIVENAKAAALIALGVVTRRSHERVRVARAPGDHGFDRGDRAARREARNVVRADADRCGLARLAAGLGGVRQALDFGNVLGRVDALELRDRGAQRRDGRELVDETGHAQQIVHAALGVGILIVDPGLEEETKKADASVEVNYDD